MTPDRMAENETALADGMDLLDETDKLRKEVEQLKFLIDQIMTGKSIGMVVPMQIACDCIKMLEEAGYGKPGHGNTLWSMVRQACDEVKGLRATKV